MNAQNHNQLCRAMPLNTIFTVNYNVKKVFFTIVFVIYLVLSLIFLINPTNLPLLKTIILLGSFPLILLSTRIRREHVSIYIFVGFLLTCYFGSVLFVWQGRSIRFTNYYFIVSKSRKIKLFPDSCSQR